jgi:nucleosome binding factor SPN SPT16 subunit
MGDIQIDKTTFHDRLSGFLAAWKNDKRSGDAVFSGASSMFICVGKATEAVYSKTAALQLWLLGYEFPATLIVVTPDAIHFVTTKKKAVYLENLKGGKVAVEVHIRGKDADENAGIFQRVAQVMKDSGVCSQTLILISADAK